jgi:hypothetical protein
MQAALKSTISYDSENEFPLENIPFGCFKKQGSNIKNCCTRIGDKIINLSAIFNLFDGPIF